MCGNYSREETIQGRKLYEEIRYPMEATGAAYGGEAHSAQRGVLPVYFPVDLFLPYIVVNPRERKLAKHTFVHLYTHFHTHKLLGQHKDMHGNKQFEKYVVI